MATMQMELQQVLSRRIFDHLDASTTDQWPEVVRQPVDAYTSPERAKAECRLLRTRPLFIGLSSLLPEPGDWITDEETGAPVLILRGRDGTLRAFANVLPPSGRENRGRQRLRCRLIHVPLPRLDLRPRRTADRAAGRTQFSGRSTAPRTACVRCPCRSATA